MKNQFPKDETTRKSLYDEQVKVGLEPKQSCSYKSAGQDLKIISQQETQKIGSSNEIIRKKKFLNGIQSVHKQIKKGTNKMNKSEKYMQKQFLNKSFKIFCRLNNQFKKEYDEIAQEKEKNWESLISCNQKIDKKCYKSLKEKCVGEKPNIDCLKKLQDDVGSDNLNFRITQFRKICLAAKVDFRMIKAFKDKDQKENYEKNLKIIESNIQNPKSGEQRNKQDELKKYILAFRQFIEIVKSLKQNGHIKKVISFNEDDFINLAKKPNTRAILEQVFTKIKESSIEVKAIFNKFQSKRKNKIQGQDDSFQYYLMQLDNFRKKKIQTLIDNKETVQEDFIFLELFQIDDIYI